MSSTRRVVAFFHGDPCIDGSFSAYVLNEAFKNDPHSKVDFVPLTNGDPLAQRDFIARHLVAGADHYFMDISPKAPAMDMLLGEAASALGIPRLIFIDHHGSEVKRLQAYAGQLVTKPNGPDVRFILDRKAPSAAGLVWKHFFPNQEPPALLNWIGRMETSMRNPDDFAIADYIDNCDISTPETAFANFDKLLVTDRDIMLEEGHKTLLPKQQRIIKAIDETLCYTRLETAPGKTHWIPIVNLAVRKCGRVVDYFLLATAAEELLNKGGDPKAFKIAGAWFEDPTGKVQFSLRSCGRPDVGNIAHYLGDTIGMSGGGRERAACIQFEDTAHFFAAVPFFTRAQMLKLQKSGDQFLRQESLFCVERLLEPPRSSTPPLAPVEAMTAPTAETAPPLPLAVIQQNLKALPLGACAL